MHQCNPYKDNPPNFTLLAKKYPELTRFLLSPDKDYSCLNFKDPECNRLLSILLLKSDFNLNIEIPKGYLPPAIPNRLDYLFWIKDLTGDDNVSILDIGTGASCIYPILGSRVFTNATFYGTESNPLSMSTAKENIQRNNLQDRIKLFSVNNDEFVPDSIVNQADRFGALMCNPPFYSSAQELELCTKAKSSDPFSVTQMYPSEYIFENGGDLGFAKAILSDSFRHKEKIQWYSIMFGKKSSFISFAQILKRHINNGKRNEKKKDKLTTDITTTTTTITAIKSTSFQQGETKRWFIAWSFSPSPSKDIGENKKVEKKIYNVNMNEFIDSLLTIEGVSRISQDAFMIEYNSWIRRVKRGGKKDILNMELIIHKEFDHFILKLKNENHWNNLQSLVKFTLNHIHINHQK